MKAQYERNLIELWRTSLIFKNPNIVLNNQWTRSPYKTSTTIPAAGWHFVSNYQLLMSKYFERQVRRAGNTLYDILLVKGHRFVTEYVFEILDKFVPESIFINI